MRLRLWFFDGAFDDGAQLQPWRRWRHCSAFGCSSPSIRRRCLGRRRRRWHPTCCLHGRLHRGGGGRRYVGARRGVGVAFDVRVSRVQQPEVLGQSLWRAMLAGIGAFLRHSPQYILLLSLWKPMQRRNHTSSHISAAHTGAALPHHLHAAMLPRDRRLSALAAARLPESPRSVLERARPLSQDGYGKNREVILPYTIFHLQ